MVMWGQIATRPDLSFSVSLLACFPIKPRKGTLECSDACHRLHQEYPWLRIDILMRLRPLTICFCWLRLKGLQRYSSFDFGVRIHDGWGAVSWSSKQQATVALSTVEAEYVAMSRCTQQMVWMHSWLREVEINFQAPGMLKGDKGAIALTKNTKVSVFSLLLSLLFLHLSHQYPSISTKRLHWLFIHLPSSFLLSWVALSWWPFDHTYPFSFSYVKELSCILNTSVFVLQLRCKSLYYTYCYLYSFIVVSIFHFQVLLIYFSVCSPTEVIYISFPVFQFSLQLLQVMGPGDTSDLSSRNNQALSLPKIQDDSSNWATYSERILNYLTSKGYCRHVQGMARKLENIVESKDGKFYLGNSKEAISDEQLEKHKNSLDLYNQTQAVMSLLMLWPCIRPFSHFSAFCTKAFLPYCFLG